LIKRSDPVIVSNNLVLPSIMGGLLGGYFTLKFYEPLPLYIKYKDLADEGEID